MDGWKTREREREREKSEERGKISLFDKINSIRHPATDIIFLFSHIEKEREDRAIEVGRESVCEIDR